MCEAEYLLRKSEFEAEVRAALQESQLCCHERDECANRVYAFMREAACRSRGCCGEDSDEDDNRREVFEDIMHDLCASETRALMRAGCKKMYWVFKTLSQNVFPEAEECEECEESECHDPSICWRCHFANEAHAIEFEEEPSKPPSAVTKRKPKDMRIQKAQKRVSAVVKKAIGCQFADVKFQRACKNEAKFVLKTALQHIARAAHQTQTDALFAKALKSSLENEKAPTSVASTYLWKCIAQESY